jgi:Zn-dependent protease
MFIPGLGAFVRLKAHPATKGQDARVGLAGPIWGAAAAIACWLLYLVTGKGIFAGLAHTGAVINLFNLLPFWQLDGGRGVLPLTRAERVMLGVIAVAVFAVTHEPWVILVAIGLGVRAFWGVQGDGDRGAMLQFAGLLAVLGGLAMVRGGA